MERTHPFTYALSVMAKSSLKHFQQELIQMNGFTQRLSVYVSRCNQQVLTASSYSWIFTRDS